MEKKKKPPSNCWQTSKESQRNSLRGESSKYENACQKIQESLKKYIDKHDLNNVAEDEEDQQFVQPEIIEKIFGSYSNKKDAAKLQCHLEEAFLSGALTCLICIENVKRNDSVWSCEVCYCSFHLGCIQKWAKDSIFLQSQDDDNDASVRNANRPKHTKECNWFCPKCRSEYPKKKIPYDYFCFCGKLKNPSFDPWLVPHSCGEKCDRLLQPNCGHRCLLLCHPGPCPPCPQMVQHPCFCPKASKQTRRCAFKEWSCGSICGRFLPCKQHKCRDQCHAGSCSACTKTSIQKCQCGAISQQRPCADLVWQCDKICGKLLSCRHHKCQRVCHKQPCGDCPFGGVRSCPCGKNVHDLPCTEIVPTCGDTCSKPLSCGTHFCAERCHKGPCPQCLQVSVKKCPCGSREKELPCSKPFTCEAKCKRIRDCRKHACNKKCCVGDCPPCEQPCGKTLGCGQHKCESRCHQTRCFPCSIVRKVSCACGGTSITVPCGRERKTAIPKCSLPCKKKSVCHHPKSAPHPCHPGDCPPCTRQCRLVLSCRHICPALCHDVVSVKVGGSGKRAGPWEKINSYVEVKKMPCPPCMVQIPNVCRGGHETSDWACSELRSYSCGRECGRKLSCSHHKCSKDCHMVEGASNDISQGVNCQPCEQPCTQPRPDGCVHQCQMPCHPGACSHCQKKVQMKCHCQILTIVVGCVQWVASNKSTRERLMSCTNYCPKVMSCKHPCQKICHSGECSSPQNCEKKVAVRCPCKRIRKDFACPLVTSGKSLVSCDSVCIAKQKEIKKAEEAIKLKQKLEEEERSRKELEEYERILHGRKRRKRRDTHSVQEDADLWWRKKHVWGILAILTTSIIFAFVFHFIANR